MLKNLEKLNGFHISPITPIEMIYDVNCNLESYSLLLERENYPFVMYGKFDINFDLIEFYPWKLYGLTDFECVDIILNNIDFNAEKNKNNNSQHCYFSVDINTLKINDYYDCSSKLQIKRFNYKSKEIKMKYEPIYLEHTLNSLLDKEQKLKNFIKNTSPNFGWVYVPISQNKTIKKILIGYSFCEDCHYKKYNELHLYDIIKKSYELIKS